ncbi:MAG: NUDIX domain-containing protein [Enhygromyxa sp.]
MAKVPDERIAVVDDDNRFLRYEPRRLIHEQQLVHRSVYLLVFDPDDRLVIQQRHRDKQTWPLYWDISCAGHVDEQDYAGHPDAELDRAYELAATRELAEELGVRAPLSLLGHFGPRDGVGYEQIRLFRASWAGPITVQAEEVEAHRWISAAQFQALADDPAARFTPALRHFGALARARGWWGSSA